MNRLAIYVLLALRDLAFYAIVFIYRISPYDICVILARSECVAMTSFIINAHLPRQLPKSWDVDCPFCRILSGELPSFKIYENEHAIAFLGPSSQSQPHPESINKLMHFPFTCRYPPTAPGSHASNPQNAHPTPLRFTR